MKITDEQITEAADQSGAVFGVEFDYFEKGARWMREQMQPEVPFTTFVQGLELSQKDKDLVKGVYYGWLASRQ